MVRSPVMSARARLFPDPRSRLPGGFLGMLAVVLVLDLAFFRSDRFATDQAESWRFKGAWARERGERGEILVFGDSLCEFGVLPGVLRERSGREARNLAMHNGTPAASYFLLRRALDSGARPGAIVVDFMPHQLGMSPGVGMFDRSWPGLLSGREALELAATLRDAGFLARTMTAKALGCVAARHEVRAAIAAICRGEGHLPRQDVRVLRRHWLANRGAQVVPDRAARPPESFEGLFPATWVCDPATEAYVRRFLDLAEEHRVPVYWLLPPLRPGAQEWRDRRGLDTPYLGYIARLQTDHAGLTVLDGRRGGYDDGHFADAIHLNRRGASALSLAVAEALDATRTPGVRIARVPFREPGPGPRGVEDLRETRIALRLEQERRSSRVR